MASALDDEDILAPDILVDVEMDLAVAEPFQDALAQVDLQVRGDLPGEREFDDPANTFMLVSFSFALGAPRWFISLQLGREDSNPRIADPKSAALPLGDAPASSPYRP